MDSIHPLKAFRDSHDPPLTQEQLAERLGVSKVSVSRWETGERKPEPELLPAISAETGVSAAQLRPDLAELFASPTAPERRDPARPRRASARAKSNAA